MLIADVMALVVPPVTDLLRRTRARGGTHGEQPMFPTIIAVRNGRVVAGVSTPRTAATLSAARTLAVGVDAAALVLAAQAEVDGHSALVYTVMTRDLLAKQVLQRVELGPEGRVAVGTPQEGGEPQDDTLMRTLAEAMGHRPVDVTRVARRDGGGTFGEDLYLPPEQGRVVVDAGTVRTLHERVRGIAGEVFYVPRSPEAARLALEAGMPRQALVDRPTRVSG
ncbi:hypothetical protein ACQE98_05610 [Ornithinimicrobium sp. W1679]|uniref:hypothetical protein n=1 Tax=unclassified Ornithinimicrobium TaxID=2615080 RepID=UPI003CEE2CE8